MEIISTAELQELVNYKRFGKNIFADVILNLLKHKKANEFYAENCDKEPLDFIDAIFNYMGFQYTLTASDVKRIPSKGAFIVIANHPFGTLDALLLSKIVGEIRPDFKVVANNLLNQVAPLQDCFFPFQANKKSKGNNQITNSLTVAKEHLMQGNSLGIFPVGDASTYNFSTNNKNDKEWNAEILKFLIDCELPIVPVNISGAYSPVLHFFGDIYPLLQTVKIPAKLFNKKNNLVHIRIGNPISEVEQRFESPSEYGRYLRAKTYSLGNSLDIEKFYLKPFLGVKKKQVPVIKEISKDILIAEIEKLKANDLLFEMSQYSVLCTSADKIPHIILEIGRLREITFREVGEGTNKAIDLDQYDLYYYHLIIWDNTENQIVGSYRIGKGKDIIKNYGLKGLYIRSLFKINEECKSLLEQSLELGRSFIVKEYQKKPLPLFLLWKGILSFLLQNKEYRYLIGPLSISNKFSKFSKSLIVSFIRSNYFNDELAQFIKPRKRFKIPKKHHPDVSSLVNGNKNDIENIDKLIVEIETDLRIPVLLKKYLSMNAQIIGFNVDPLFNNCLDGLIILDIFNIPQKMIDSLSKEL